jgi:hypothetical protein
VDPPGPAALPYVKKEAGGAFVEDSAVKCLQRTWAPGIKKWKGLRRLTATKWSFADLFMPVTLGVCNRRGQCVPKCQEGTSSFSEDFEATLVDGSHLEVRDSKSAEASVQHWERLIATDGGPAAPPASAAASASSSAASSSSASPPSASASRSVVSVAFDGTYESPSGKIVVRALNDHALKVSIHLQRGTSSGVAEGTARLEGVVATYTSSEFGPCSIRMTFVGPVVTVTQTGRDFECGFGHGVWANGTYTRTSHP